MGTGPRAFLRNLPRLAGTLLACNVSCGLPMLFGNRPKSDELLYFPQVCGDMPRAGIFFSLPMLFLGRAGFGWICCYGLPRLCGDMPSVFHFCSLPMLCGDMPQSNELPFQLPRLCGHLPRLTNIDPAHALSLLRPPQTLQGHAKYIDCLRPRHALRGHAKGRILVCNET